LKKQEGFFKRLSRKRRAWIGGLVANMIGEQPKSDYQFLPPTQKDAPQTPGDASLRDEIEEAGLIGGIASRVKKTADSYLNQKLDEIDSRLAEWRDKEIANRIKILKITLWVSVIVGAFALMYSYVKVYFFPHLGT
jgi:hypothetical protein